MKKQISRLICTVFAAVLLSLPAQATPRMLIPGGAAVGIRLQTKGLVVTGFDDGSAAKAAGVKKGDVITCVDGQEVRTVAALKECLGKEEVVLTVLRNGKQAQFCVAPKTGQLGAYVKDSIAGIGTITYYDPVSGGFGALGHGVNDVFSSGLLPVEEGQVVPSVVTDVEKGKSGEPGELKGQFDLQRVLGSVERNSSGGIFGTLREPLNKKPLPVCPKDEVQPGKAQILSNVEGDEIRTYEVEILRVHPGSRNGRNLLVKVTDKDLLNTTGGIVQGMSGSPIIQNGKLVGAVTHVLVNDPTCGYGIFIENMLDAAG